MLILGRREGDAILIGDNIRLVVLACDRKGVRLGIEAPSHVTILREEIIRDVTEENLRAEIIPTGAEWMELIAGLRPAEPSGSVAVALPRHAGV
ncbi:MAG TPA: carbon storage regulator [Gemmatimonadaceae bacterium]|nr:carbon storage regulator [Gemmatimonadaceae bacterium]